MQTYEVEVKSLLGAEEKANVLRKRLKELDPKTKLISKNKQLNHYFTKGNLDSLSKSLGKYITNKTQKQLVSLSKNASDFSVRTRQKDKEVFIVIKASVGEDTSSNGVARIELEQKVKLSLAKLDALVLKSGFVYQAKWSREREEYAFKDIAVTLDKNAGYGWLAEFEKVVKQKSKVEAARAQVFALMAECKLKELKQARLARMFKFYNSNWKKYYGTDKVFTIN